MVPKEGSRGKSKVFVLSNTKFLTLPAYLWTFMFVGQFYFSQFYCAMGKFVRIFLGKGLVG